MHPRDGLHHPPIAMPQSLAVGFLHLRDVGAPETRDGDAGIAFENAGHARCPQQFVAQMAIHELMKVTEVLEQLPGLAERRSHQFDQRFGIVCRDDFVGQRGSHRLGVSSLGDLAIGRDPQ